MTSNHSDKDRELGDAYAEIKALKYQEHLKDKAVEEVVLTHCIFSQLFITINFFCYRRLWNVYSFIICYVCDLTAKWWAKQSGWKA